MINVPRLAACALLVCSFAACSRSADGAGAPSPESATIKRRDPARVRVEPVVRREMLRVLETTTRVESEHQVELMSRSSGLVIEILAEEGDSVAEGQVLARLDARELAIAAADAEVALEDARAAGPRLELATREAEAKLEISNRSVEQMQRDYDRNEAISQASPDRPALLSPKDLDASRLARDRAVGESKNSALFLERVRMEREDGKTTTRRAQLVLDRARLSLANMSITAPFAGILAARNIKVGETISGSTSAFTLTDPERLRAVFYRPQRELGLFVRKPANADAPAAASDGGLRSAEVELFASAEALPGRRFRGAIERIAPTIDPQSGNFRVTARLNGDAEGVSGPRLLPGMLVRLEIITERHAAALVIPKRALRREGDAKMVFVIRNDRAVRVGVAEGLNDDEALEVTALGGARLEAGDMVVVVGNRDLEDGSEVSIATEAEFGAEALPAGIEATAPNDAGAAPAAGNGAAAEPAASTAPADAPADDPKPARDSTPSAEPAAGGGQ